MTVWPSLFSSGLKFQLNVQHFASLSHLYEMKANQLTVLWLVAGKWGLVMHNQSNEGSFKDCSHNRQKHAERTPINNIRKTFPHSFSAYSVVIVLSARTKNHSKCQRFKSFLETLTANVKTESRLLLRGRIRKDGVFLCKGCKLF